MVTPRNNSEIIYILGSFHNDSTASVYKLREAVKIKRRPKATLEQMYKKYIYEEGKETLEERKAEKDNLLVERKNWRPSRREMKTVQ